jgi:SAM-dependent methyltransferase
MNKIISSSQIQSINSRYTNRLLVHGNSPLSLGWSDKSQQYLRFNRFLDAIIRYPEPYSILDVGCGFGDFASFLESSKNPPKLYTGIDINNDLLEVARAKHYSCESHFFCANILADDKLLAEDTLKSSFVMAAGLFNYNFHDSSKKMHEFVFAMIEKMLSLCTERVIIDFIPDNRIDSYEPEPYIALYSIPKILTYLADKGLLFSIDLTQKPNPMQEALLIINVTNPF